MIENWRLEKGNREENMTDQEDPVGYRTEMESKEKRRPLKEKAIVGLARNKALGKFPRKPQG